MGNNKPIMTVKEVAEYLRVTTTTIYRYLEDGKLPHFKMGRYLRIRREDVETFVEQQLAVKTDYEAITQIQEEIEEDADA
jgi:excisionase family DNA binding protein